MYYQPQPYPNHTIRNTNNDERRVITVFGEGSISIEPNIAKVRLGVITQNRDLSVAQKENANTINQVIQVILGFGVTRENIRTADYTIRQEYDYVDGTQQFRGYVVTHLLEVTVNEIVNVGQIIDASVDAGVNRVVDVRFSVRNQEEYIQIALTRALENAMSKALVLINTVNANIDPVPINIEERVEAPPGIYQTFAQVDSQGTTIEPGLLEIRANVEVKFKFTV